MRNWLAIPYIVYTCGGELRQITEKAVSEGYCESQEEVLEVLKMMEDLDIVKIENDRVIVTDWEEFNRIVKICERYLKMLESQS